MTTDIQPAERLQRIASALSAGEPPPTPTVREFLAWFGAMRRGQWIVRDIRASLKKAGLVTTPDFEGAYIDSLISITPAPQVAATVGTAVSAAEAVGVGEGLTAVLVSDSSVPVSIGVGDPTYRLSKLAAANRPPTSVPPDAPIVDAVTLMLSNDFSQLPVMTNDRTVKGLVSWRSIGARWALDRDGQFVREFMDKVEEIGADSSIFSALPVIVEHGYVLVRDSTARVTGIVTTSDLSLQFQQLAEPFLLLGEIENQVRRLMDGKFTKEDLGVVRE